jgi:hypothetical protein
MSMLKFIQGYLSLCVKKAAECGVVVLYILKVTHRVNTTCLCSDDINN